MNFHASRTVALCAKQRLPKTSACNLIVQSPFALMHHHEPPASVHDSGVVGKNRK